jgi:NADH-quinone oxidoreductase subunit J
MDMQFTDILFYLFAFLATFGALAVILLQNPVYSALFLAVTMSVLAILFFMLQAPFVAAAQVIVYAGAVMVLFVMVIMLFNLKADQEKILPVRVSTGIKLGAALLLLLVLSGSSWLAISQVSPEEKDFGSTADLSKLLFTNHVFSFEAVSFLLLVAIVGAVALSRSRGGTHAR